VIIEFAALPNSRINELAARFDVIWLHAGDGPGRDKERRRNKPAACACMLA